MAKGDAKRRAAERKAAVDAWLHSPYSLEDLDQLKEYIGSQPWESNVWSWNTITKLLSTVDHLYGELVKERERVSK